MGLGLADPSLALTLTRVQHRGVALSGDVDGTAATHCGGEGVGLVRGRGRVRVRGSEG